jgi:hypothetical protein
MQNVLNNETFYMAMTLTDLGLTDEIRTYIKNNCLSGFSVGRVTQEHRERYIVSTGENEFDAEITGNLSYVTKQKELYFFVSCFKIADSIPNLFFS